jgi:NDP-sugar pyrophosphorylase family protein
MLFYSPHCQEFGKMIKTAVVLAGGAGLRLRPLTNNKPKVMLKVAGKPILQWVIEWLKFNGISNLVIGVAHKKETIMRYFRDGSKLGVQIKYSVHSIEGETGEGFRLAVSRYVDDDLFVAMNGDEMTNFRLNDMLNQHLSNNVLATIAVTNPASPFGIIRIDDKGLIQSFEEKPILTSLFVSIGIYVFNREILKYLPEKGAIEKTTFPLLAQRKLLGAYKTSGDWFTVNTIKELQNTENELKRKLEKGTWLASQ